MGENFKNVACLFDSSTNVFKHCPDQISHIRLTECVSYLRHELCHETLANPYISPSIEQLAIYELSLLKSIDVTGSECADIVLKHFPAYNLN